MIEDLYVYGMLENLKNEIDVVCNGKESVFKLIIDIIENKSTATDSMALFTCQYII